MLGKNFNEFLAECFQYLNEEEFDPEIKGGKKKELTEVEPFQHPGPDLAPFHDVAKKHGYEKTGETATHHIYKRKADTIQIRKDWKPVFNQGSNMQPQMHKVPAFVHTTPLGKMFGGRGANGMDTHLSQHHAIQGGRNLEAEKQRAADYQASKATEKAKGEAGLVKKTEVSTAGVRTPTELGQHIPNVQRTGPRGTPAPEYDETKLRDTLRKENDPNKPQVKPPTVPKPGAEQTSKSSFQKRLSNRLDLIRALDKAKRG